MLEVTKQHVPTVDTERNVLVECVCLLHPLKVFSNLSIMEQLPTALHSSPSHMLEQLHHKRLIQIRLI